MFHIPSYLNRKVGRVAHKIKEILYNSAHSFVFKCFILTCIKTTAKIDLNYIL